MVLRRKGEKFGERVEAGAATPVVLAQASSVVTSGREVKAHYSIGGRLPKERYLARAPPSRVFRPEQKRIRWIDEAETKRRRHL